MPFLSSRDIVFTNPGSDPGIMKVSFERTLRIPDTDTSYPLPPTFGSFQPRHVEDFKDRLPPDVLNRGGLILPMWQSEALWISFRSISTEWGSMDEGAYPYAIKVAAGKINAVTGEPWTEDLGQDPQNYLVAPNQPWLDGFMVKDGFVRQFVASELGDGLTAEEQITGNATWGGLQISATPMRLDAYRRHVSRLRERRAMAARRFETQDLDASMDCCIMGEAPEPSFMGMAPGGLMRQEIYKDPFGIDVWDALRTERVFVTLVHAKDWHSLTGEHPPSAPPRADEYARAGLPWFEYYGSDQVLSSTETLGGLKSINQISSETYGDKLPHSDDVPVETINVVQSKISEFPKRPS